MYEQSQCSPVGVSHVTSFITCTEKPADNLFCNNFRITRFNTYSITFKKTKTDRTNLTHMLTDKNIFVLCVLGCHGQGHCDAAAFCGLKPLKRYY